MENSKEHELAEPWNFFVCRLHAGVSL